MDVIINKKTKCATREDLEKLSKEEIIDYTLRLEAHIVQLRNLYHKKLNDNSDPSKPIRHGNRKFDFNNAHKRHVLLRLLYFGFDYHGFASQEDSNNTIEHHIFDALQRTCLIESRATSNYHRCGRTDKGVSAFSQVISIDLRSKLPPSKQLCETSLADEIDYCGILNRVLPRNIQCIAWKPLENTSYSARFDCIARTYRYYFPRGTLNIEHMREACILLERHTDFRNFCKMDVQNGVTNFTRNLQSATIELCENENEDGTGYSMYFLEIKANAFLFHQIRCIMTILLLIGQGKEEVNVINELFDIDNNPCKPQYTPALPLPLNLFKCEFKDSSNVSDEVNCHESHNGKPETVETLPPVYKWVYDKNSLSKLIENLQSQWTLHNVKTTMIRDVLNHVTETLFKEFNLGPLQQQVSILQDVKPCNEYQKLLSRKRCESLENRIEHFVKKQRIVVKSDSSEKHD